MSSVSSAGQESKTYEIVNSTPSSISTCFTDCKSNSGDATYNVVPSNDGFTNSEESSSNTWFCYNTSSLSSSQLSNVCPGQTFEISSENSKCAGSIACAQGFVAGQLFCIDNKIIRNPFSQSNEALYEQWEAGYIQNSCTNKQVSKRK